ncbi:hypothetical protein Nepgr_031090 [Nepenthes gracilis]|uniref:DUF4005 domain-containing protein n=1 Tax=Nepenthes gracilis TaxID=150966 RepID=A0AAD3Y4H4_NEPGR|nr:hypothetical protein Nepgr_031090 [Nepenthes gracilis]
MEKACRWIMKFFTGKMDKEKHKKKRCNRPPVVCRKIPTNPIVFTTTPTPKQRRRWSLRRFSATAGGKDSNSASAAAATIRNVLERDRRHHALAVAAATAAAANAAVAAVEAAAAVIRLTAPTNGSATAIEVAAAVKIQCVFRSHLARKALHALRGLVKLQALVRGHLVRKQAAATLRCMRATVGAQGKARVQRIRGADDANAVSYRHSTDRKSDAEKFISFSYHVSLLAGLSTEIDGAIEEKIKIVEMDESKGSSKSRNGHSRYPESESTRQRSIYTHASQSRRKKSDQHRMSPAASAITVGATPRTSSAHFDEYSFANGKSSLRFSTYFPHQEYAESMSYCYKLYPNYMANTESSRAKARSQSAPRQRPEFLERQPSRRRSSVEGRNASKAARILRSSSPVDSTAESHRFPWSFKLDRSSVSLRDSECGSTCSVATNYKYCRSLVSYDQPKNSVIISIPGQATMSRHRPPQPHPTSAAVATHGHMAVVTAELSDSSLSFGLMDAASWENILKGALLSSAMAGLSEGPICQGICRSVLSSRLHRRDDNGEVLFKKKSCQKSPEPSLFLILWCKRVCYQALSFVDFHFGLSFLNSFFLKLGCACLCS